MKVCDLFLQEVGFGRGQLVLVAGRPCIGKTSFAISGARQLAAKGYKICYFMLGESRDQWLEKYSKGDTDGSGMTDNIDLISDSPQTVDRIGDHIRRAKPDLVIVDHIQLIDRGDEGLKEVEGCLRDMADMYSIPVMVLSHLGRNVESRKDHTPRFDDLKSIGLDSDVFDQGFLLYRPHYYYPEEPDSELLVVMKGKEEQLVWDYPTLSVL